jgi:hypothetical protein
MTQLLNAGAAVGQEYGNGRLGVNRTCSLQVARAVRLYL